MVIFTRAILGLKRELFPLEEWIQAGGREAAIDPDFPIVDAHHHLWDVRSQDKGWPISKFAIWVLYKLKPSILQTLICQSQDECVIKTFSFKLPMVVPYMEASMLRDIENAEKQGDDHVPLANKKSTKSSDRILSLPSHNIVATVLIESGWKDPLAKSVATEAVPEVTMAQQVAKKTNNRICTGIVGHVPLSEGADEVRSALEAMRKSSPNLRGIRDTLAFWKGLYSPDPAAETKAYDKKFRSGFSVLREFNLTYDTWLYCNNIPALRDLALAFPDTTIICNHCGKPVGLPPSNPQTALKEWKPIIDDLARSCPNVHIKLSGLGMATFGFGFHNRPKPPNSKELADAWRPFILHCIKCFGIERCMFASNFPVDKISCSYTQLFNAFKLIVQEFSLEDKKKLFHDNAVRIYCLDVP